MQFSYISVDEGCYSCRSSHPHFGFTQDTWKPTSSLNPPVFHETMKKGVFVGELSAVAERLCSSDAQGAEILTGPGTHVRKELQKREEENTCEIPS